MPKTRAGVAFYAVISAMLTFTACKSPSTIMKSVIYTPEAPAPIGPYSQATSAGGFVFISGQIAINPGSGEMYTGGDISAETRQVMENLKAIVTQSGAGMGDILKCTIFLRDMNDFAAVNAVYGEYFTEYPPARETVAVVGLPKNARVEISAIVIAR